jgi:hypothetical protein
MATVSTRRESAKSSKSRRPLDARLTLSIRGTSYAVEPIAAEIEGISPAWRLVKLDGSDKVYDIAMTPHGATCDCPDFVARHEGLDTSGCKHIQAARLVGLLPSIGTVVPPASAFRPLPDEFDEPSRDVVLVGDDGTTLAEADRWHADDHLAAVAVASGTAELLTDKPTTPPIDLDLYRCQNAVAEGRALWLSHRHLHTGEPLPAQPEPAGEPEPAGDAPFDPATDWPDHVGSEHDRPAEHEDEDLDAGADWDGDDGRWDTGEYDADRWTTTGLDADNAVLSFAEWIEIQAMTYDRMRTPASVWLAGQIARLAEQARFLDADGPVSFEDRRDALLDAAACEAERRAACC